jgi:hypothetical protein
MLHRLLLFFVLFSSIGYSQTLPTKEDSARLDSMMLYLNGIAQNWNPDEQVWTFIEFEYEELQLSVKYGQRPIHPFLAEYERKVQFEIGDLKTDTLDMSINSGGKTFIKVFYDADGQRIIMEDFFGGYYYNIRDKLYSERKTYEGFKAWDGPGHLGSINGKELPLKFERK